MFFCLTNSHIFPNMFMRFELYASIYKVSRNGAHCQDKPGASARQLPQREDGQTITASPSPCLRDEGKNHAHIASSPYIVYIL